MMRVLGLVVLVIALCLQSVQGSRVLNGDAWEKREKELMVFKDMKRGPVAPSGPSGCTNVGGRTGSGCPPLTTRNFAGVRMRPLMRASYPQQMGSFGTAKAYNETHNQS
ncbi:hypothetical protein AMTR_s00002p00261470 [Amborella trichopoda]|uniref:Uncharacterized protein n=1 Tax=Amborella trichopoda TaxID=13333 RepID=W1P1D5_AMBTC|nr:hypothetical protein AMTR_s00002p00261470 [Amborella trichopoda]